ncbi:unannotated protein [freshwater metagenome]|uniref:Unannotated protein n=1 Tax=freshwater metagenome TaxID=449393 RepID=A0A6J7E0U1_9ZZZZ|nr:MATE family efflux transporter [Actinomycetota bacterium]
MRWSVCDDTRVTLSALDRRIIALALPALGTLAIEPLYILVDTAIVGRLGTAKLAGLAIAGTVLLTITALLGFMQYGVTPEVAHARGSGDGERARVVANDALWLAVLLGVPVAVTVALLARPLARLLGATGGVLDAATTYLSISAIGLPFVFITLVGHGVMRGHNDLRKPLLIVLAANVANVVIEIVVVYGFKMGIAGSAWSTVVVQVLAAGAFATILGPHLARVRPAWQRIKPFLVIGGHLGLRSAAMLVVWITVTRVAAHVDTPTLAAHQVLFQLFSFLALILDALAIPAQSLVAGAMGGLDAGSAMAVGWSSAKLSLYVGGGLCVLVGATSPFVPHIFTGDGAVISRVTAGLLFLAVIQIPGAVAFALDGALIGGQDGKFLGRAAVFNLVAYAPFLIATLVHPALGIGGLWGGQLAWMTLRAVVNARRFKSKRWMPAVALTG